MERNIPSLVGVGSKKWDSILRYGHLVSTNAEHFTVLPPHDKEPRLLGSSTFPSRLLLDLPIVVLPRTKQIPLQMSPEWEDVSGVNFGVGDALAIGNQRHLLPEAPEKKPRNGGPKVKTGCLTCK